MRKQISNDQGFTLLEVLTSMFIMSFSMLLLLHLAMVALDGNTWASGTTSSTQLLQEKLEELRSFDDPESGADTVGQVYRDWTVTTAGSHLRQVALTATWYSPDSLAHSNTITTLIKTDSL
ncbi:MAG: prepilin-type N-terminal cleavage/methylation domain-containing protein [FCB group bacterium]|nr:prepilin-type N-terminal cleavage/methylation domain-containing protein [FCB group bacterium]